MIQLASADPTERATDPLWGEIREEAISLRGWFRRKHSLSLNHPLFLEATESLILEEYLQNEAFEEFSQPELLNRKKLERWEKEIADSADELRRWKDKWGSVFKKETQEVVEEKKSSLLEQIKKINQKMKEE